jgi:hypothetical protein
VPHAKEPVVRAERGGGDLGITVSSHAEIAPKLEVVLKGYLE